MLTLYIVSSTQIHVPWCKVLTPCTTSHLKPRRLPSHTKHNMYRYPSYNGHPLQPESSQRRRDMFVVRQIATTGSHELRGHSFKDNTHTYCGTDRTVITHQALYNRTCRPTVYVVKTLLPFRGVFVGNSSKERPEDVHRATVTSLVDSRLLSTKLDPLCVQNHGDNILRSDKTKHASVPCLPLVALQIRKRYK